MGLAGTWTVDFEDMYQFRNENQERQRPIKRVDDEEEAEAIANAEPPVLSQGAGKKKKGRKNPRSKQEKTDPASEEEAGLDPFDSDVEAGQPAGTATEADEVHEADVNEADEAGGGTDHEEPEVQKKAKDTRPTLRPQGSKADLMQQIGGLVRDGDKVKAEYQVAIRCLEEAHQAELAQLRDALAADKIAHADQVAALQEAHKQELKEAADAFAKEKSKLARDAQEAADAFAKEKIKLTAANEESERAVAKANGQVAQLQLRLAEADKALLKEKEARQAVERINDRLKNRHHQVVASLSQAQNALQRSDSLIALDVPASRARGKLETVNEKSEAEADDEDSREWDQGTTGRAAAEKRDEEEEQGHAEEQKSHKEEEEEEEKSHAEEEHGEHVHSPPRGRKSRRTPVVSTQPESPVTEKEDDAPAWPDVTDGSPTQVYTPDSPSVLTRLSSVDSNQRASTTSLLGEESDTRRPAKRDRAVAADLATLPMGEESGADTEEDSFSQIVAKRKK